MQTNDEQKEKMISNENDIENVIGDYVEVINRYSEGGQPTVVKIHQHGMVSQEIKVYHRDILKMLYKAMAETLDPRLEIIYLMKK